MLRRGASRRLGFPVREMAVRPVVYPGKPAVPRASSAVPMAHRVPIGTMTGRERFQLRGRLGGSGGARALALRLERYAGPSCGGCGHHGGGLELVTVAGGVWRLCACCQALLVKDWPAV